jgi:hypothetical protein
MTDPHNPGRVQAKLYRLKPEYEDRGSDTNPRIPTPEASPDTDIEEVISLLTQLHGRALVLERECGEALVLVKGLRR